MSNDFAPGAYSRWLSSGKLSDSELSELEAIVDNEGEIEARFFAPPEFGTAGLRGEMGAGLRLMNTHVVRWVTQAFAEIINEDRDGAEAKAAVCHDCREHSREFALEAASVLAANGIKVLLFSDLRPTPELSFAVRQYGCAGGINITASHNTSQYNGYKAYGPNGAQLSSEKSKRIADRMNEIDIFDAPKTCDPHRAEADGMIEMLGDETDELFLNCALGVSRLGSKLKSAASDLKIVYTPFHGTGYRLAPEALRRAGFSSVTLVAEQSEPDGKFPTVKSPNPENPESFELAERTARECDADLIIGTDPDADRIAIEAKSGDGYVFLTGHSTGCLLLEYVLSSMHRDGTLPKNAGFIKTIVTTNLARKIADKYGVKAYDTFTGFKFIAELKDELEAAREAEIVFSYEESYGYMPGDYTRDKDGIGASVLAAECAAYHKARGKTLVDALSDLYAEYGYHDEKTVNLVMPGLDGMEKMRQLMHILRVEPPDEIADIKVASRYDYSTGKLTIVAGGSAAASDNGLRGSDVLQFDLVSGDRLLIRPSGTEPKIKAYVLASGSDAESTVSRSAAIAEWTAGLPAREL